MSDVNFFKTVPGLTELNDAHVGALVDCFHIGDYEDGHVFIQEGASGDSAYIIVDGEVSVTRLKGAEARVKEINRMGSKEIFGIISLIDNKERTATCQARGNVKVASLSRESFEALRDQSPEISRHLQRIISRQISRDHKFFSNEIRDVIFSGKASDALANQDGLIITDTYKGPNRRVVAGASYAGPERRT